MKNFGKSSRVHSHGVQKIFMAPIYGAHCAVIFATAQLSLSPMRLRAISWVGRANGCIGARLWRVDHANTETPTGLCHTKTTGYRLSLIGYA